MIKFLHLFKKYLKLILFFLILFLRTYFDIYKMDQNMLNINNTIYNNNNNAMIEIIKELLQIINNSNDNIMINKLSNIIIQMNKLINDNKKNSELIINHIQKLQNQIEEMKQNENQINKRIIIKNDFGN